MINIGLYYAVKEGHEEEFEKIFSDVVGFLKENAKGFQRADVYRKVGKGSPTTEYMIYSEWENLASFRAFISSKEFRDTTSYGKTIIEGRPYHKVFTEVNDTTDATEG